MTTSVWDDQVAPDVDRDVRIRRASVEDLDDLGPVDEDAFGKLAYPPFVLRQLFDVHGDSWLVAEHAHGLVGYALSAPTFNRAKGWLLALAVSKEFRGNGYGRLLLRASIDLLRENKIHNLELTVDPHNKAAIALYADEGFVEHELRKDYLGPGEDRIVMGKTF